MSKFMKLVRYLWTGHIEEDEVIYFQGEKEV